MFRPILSMGVVVIMLTLVCVAAFANSQYVFAVVFIAIILICLVLVIEYIHKEVKHEKEQHQR